MRIINDMPLPSRKLIILTDPETGLSFEIKQQNKRVKYYTLDELHENEPETYQLIFKLYHALNRG